jgi:hypothetical protein
VPAEPSEAVSGHLMIMLVGVGRRRRGAEPGDLSGALEPRACVSCSPSACVGLASGGSGYLVHGEARWPARFWPCIDASDCCSGCAQSVMRNERERQRLAVLVVSPGLAWPGLLRVTVGTHAVHLTFHVSAAKPTHTHATCVCLCLSVCLSFIRHKPLPRAAAGWWLQLDTQQPPKLL